MKTGDFSSWKPYLKPAVGFAFFALALIACHHLLIEVHPSAIRAAIEKIPPSSLLLACAATVFSFLMLIGYEFSAAKYAGENLPPKTLAFGAFCAFAVSNSVGLALFSAGTVRYRLYTPHGLGGMKVAKMTLFSSGAFFLTLPLLVAALVLSHFRYTASLLHVSEPIVFAASALPLAAFLVLFGWFYYKRLPESTKYTWFSQVGPYHLELPKLRLALRQLVITALDIIAAGTTLYVLLPAPPDYASFLLVYFIALAAGFLSNVPGGLGIFETVILTAFSKSLDPASLAAGLVLYRLIYYAIPFLIACFLLLGNELRDGRGRLGRLMRSSSGLIPGVMSLLVFFAGLLLILSGSTPTVFERLKFLRLFLPAALIDTFHLSACLIGVFCLLLAQGLHRRFSGAWLLTSILLFFGAVFSLLKGWEWGTAILLLLIFGLLVLFRKTFYRTSRLTQLNFSPTYLLTLGGVVIIAFWLVFFSYKNVEYAGDLWWEFGFDANVSRSLRAVTLCALVVLAVVVRWLLRSTFNERLPDELELAKAAAVFKASDRPDAALALSGDKMLLFNKDEDAYIMYGRHQKSLIALYDPVGPAEKQPELIWQFRDLSDRYLCRPVFYQVAAENLGMYSDIGLTAFKIGEEAIVDLPGFAIESSRSRELRKIYNRGLKDGMIFEIYEAGTAPWPELKTISDQWLAAKNVREKGFSLGRFEENFLRHFRIAVLKQNGRIIAFVNLFEPDNRKRLSFDLMRHSNDAPKSCMSFFVVAMMQHFKEQGYEKLAMGMAPLSGITPYRNAPWVEKFGLLLYHRGDYFYHFQGLRQFKEKFNPEWESRYVAIPRGENLLFALADASILIAGGVGGILKK